MASEIDEDRTIIEDAFATAEKLLSENIDKLHTIAEVLLEVKPLMVNSSKHYSQEKRPLNR